MDRRAKLISIVLLCLTCIALSQEKQSLEELLCWLPAGDYSEIVHFDKETFLKTCPEDTYKTYVLAGKDLIPTGKEFLPNSLVGQFDSVTSASLVELGLKHAGIVKENGERRTINRKSAYVFEANNRIFGSWLPSERLSIYRFTDLDTLVRSAREKSEIEALPDMFDMRPVYAYRPSGKNDLLYGFATPTQEFLVAGDLITLKKMIRAGYTNDLPIFRSIDLNALLEFSSDSCYLWRFRYHAVLYKMVFDYLMQQDPNSPSMEETTKRLETGLQSALDFYSWDTNGNRFQRTVLDFGDDETARKDFELLSQNYGEYYGALWHEFIQGRFLSYKPQVAHLKQTRAQSKIESNMTLDGNRILISQMDDAETLAKILEAYSEFQKAEEERKAKNNK